MFEHVASNLTLTEEQANVVHDFVGEWQIISDLAFADLVLWVRTGDDRFVALANARPSTGQTLFEDDIISQEIDEALRPHVIDAVESREVIGDVESSEGNMIDIVPVADENKDIIAVLTAHRRPDATLTSLAKSTENMSRMEEAYRQSSREIFEMLRQGLWPQSVGTGSRRGAPRVGDGVIRLDPDDRIFFAGPNAVSAIRRLGYMGPTEGQRLVDILDISNDPSDRDIDEILPAVLKGRISARAEVENRGISVMFHSIPLLQGANKRLGAVVLCRDVSELRRSEAQLVSKDATIREIHHRVKNNLQTVAALLRLQSRRMVGNEGREGLSQAMRRVDTIASVYEALSQGLSPLVDFDELLSKQIKLSAEVATPEAFSVNTAIAGQFGQLKSDLATPLSLVINELVTNAVEHGFKNECFPQEIKKEVVVSAQRHDSSTSETPYMKVQITDNGCGLNPDDALDGLGINIVKTLVKSELKGSISWEEDDESAHFSPDEVGTVVTVSFLLE